MPVRASTGRRALLCVGGLTLLGLAHALVVATHYHFGSFDDDASYVLVAKALAAGVGLTGNVSSGYPLVGAYPPGFAALLTPITLVAPGVVLLYRLLPLVAVTAMFPLTWRWLGRHSVQDPVRLAVLLLLALNPVAATFATMVMPETVFVVAFLLLLLIAERWEREIRVVCWAGVGTVLIAASLLWLKEAAAGMVLGLTCWFLLRRAWRKGLLTLGGSAVLMAPVLIARTIVGAPLIGSRYSDELGVAAGGVIHRLVHVVPHSISTTVVSALPLSIVPTGVSPLPTHGVVGLVLDLVGWTVPPLVALGLVEWVRHHRDPSALVVGGYLLETLAYPFMNERRFVLVLPVVMTWYVVGVRTAIAAATWITRRSLASRRTLTVRANTTGTRRFVAAGVATTLVIVPLAAQFPRDYRFRFGQDSSAPDGSPYMAILSHLGSHQEVVETTYLWTTALFTGHRTASSAYHVPCDDQAVRTAIQTDRGGYLLDAALNRPGRLESECLLRVADSSPWAVRMLRTRRDEASVYELIGPGTAHPELIDLTPGPPVTTPDPPTLSWTWARPVEVRQVTLGAAWSRSGPARRVVIELLDPSGLWMTVASSQGPVREGARTRYMAVEFSSMTVASAVRITVDGPGGPAVQDFHVLGLNSP